MTELKDKWITQRLVKKLKSFGLDMSPYVKECYIDDVTPNASFLWSDYSNIVELRFKSIWFHCGLYADRNYGQKICIDIGEYANNETVIHSIFWKILNSYIKIFLEKN